MAAQIGSFLQQIGISGWGHLEAAIFAALKTGTPINLVGDKGTSKTEFCYRISLALQGDKCHFQKYDTPDVTMDQILGFPDMRAMEKGEVDFVKTGTSIWNKTAVVWDEITRVGPMMQGKLLEVVRTGEILGITTNVEFQFATCNPPRALSNSVGHDVHYLGDAMASRFFHVHVPKASVELFRAAMAVSNVRKAFAKNDKKAIGGFCADIALFWMDYKRAAPTTEEYASAEKLVATVMGMTLKKDYFDTRAAIRSVEMVAELLCLDRVTGFVMAKDLFQAAKLVICGNIAELNGIIRNDLSSERPTIENLVTQNMQIMARKVVSEPELNLRSEPFRMTQRGAFDDAALKTLENSLKKNMSPENISTVISSFVKKVTVDSSYRSTQYRSGHKNALRHFIDIAIREGVTNLNVTLFPQAVTDQNVSYDLLDSNSTSTQLAADLHNRWYKACGLGTPSA